LDNISYAKALEMETSELRNNMIEGLGSEVTVTEIAPAHGAESSCVSLKKSCDVEEISPKWGKTSNDSEGNTVSYACFCLFSQVFG
jgi:hypothetical protein